MRRQAILVPVFVATGLVVGGCQGELTTDLVVDDTVAGVTEESSASATLAPTTTAEPVTTVAPAPAEESMFVFTSADDLDGWNVVNDTVMGGVSSGESAWADGAMVFTGELSLDNNGGFASVRSPFVDPVAAARWADRDGLAVEVRGDGRSWAVEVRSFSDTGGWLSTITPPVDGFAVIDVPWATFEPVTRFLDPRDAPAPLDPTDIASVAFYLIDGIEAPFRLEVRSIS